jgi:hypothetical protein
MVLQKTRKIREKVQKKRNNNYNRQGAEGGNKIIGNK